MVAKNETKSAPVASEPVALETTDGPVVVAGGTVTVPDTMRVQRERHAGPEVEHMQHRPRTGVAVLEHATWCRPTGGRDEIRTESYPLRNDETGVLFRVTRCMECAAHVAVNQATGTVNATPGDSSQVPRSMRVDEGGEG